MAPIERPFFGPAGVTAGLVDSLAELDPVGEALDEPVVSITGIIKPGSEFPGEVGFPVAVVELSGDFAEVVGGSWALEVVVGGSGMA